MPDGPQDLPHTPSTFEIVSDPTFLVLTGLTVFQGVMFTSLTRMLSFMGGLSMAENSLKMNTHRAELLAQRIRRDAMTARDDTERNTLKNEGKLLEAYRDPIQSDFSKAQDFHGKLKSNWMYAFINFMANPALEYFARESLILPPENPEKSLKKIDDAVRMSGA